MTDLEFVKQLGEDYASVIENAKKHKYEVNEVQLNKLDEIVKTLQACIKEFGGEIEDLDLSPALLSGGVTANFIVLHLHGDMVKRFADAIREASAITFDATATGEVCISVTVPDVFKTID